MLLFDMCTIVILCYICSFSKSKARKLEKNEETCASEPPAKVSAVCDLLVSLATIIIFNMARKLMSAQQRSMNIC